MGMPHHADLPYRRGVGVMLLNRAGLVWVGERADTPGAWQMPQGGVHDGEPLEEAALRELKEETSTNNVAVLARTYDWLRYELPGTLADKVWGDGRRYRGQAQMWFACRFLGTDDEIDLEAAEDREFVAWRWVGIDDLGGLIVRFKRPLYAAVVAEFRHLTGPEG